eukprot:2019813-Prorocentrum_lima.AAC.1
MAPTSRGHHPHDDEVTRRQQPRPAEAVGLPTWRTTPAVPQRMAVARHPTSTDTESDPTTTA